MMFTIATVKQNQTHNHFVNRDPEIHTGLFSFSGSTRPTLSTTGFTGARPDMRA